MIQIFYRVILNLLYLYINTSKGPCISRLRRVRELEMENGHLYSIGTKSCRGKGVRREGEGGTDADKGQKGRNRREERRGRHVIAREARGGPESSHRDTNCTDATWALTQAYQSQPISLTFRYLLNNGLWQGRDASTFFPPCQRVSKHPPSPPWKDHELS